MLSGQAEFLAGTENDQDDAGNRAGYADDDGACDGFQAVQLVEQHDANRQQAHDERGVAGGSSLDLR